MALVGEMDMIPAVRLGAGVKSAQSERRGCYQVPMSSRHLTVHRHIDARGFLEASLSWLLKAEPENNLVLGIARRSDEGQFGFSSEEYWATVYDGDEIVGTSFRTPPHHLAVSSMPPSAIAPLAKDVGDVYSALSGVVGPASGAELFARQWTKQHGGRWRTKFRQRIHVLRSVATAENLPTGSLRQMEEPDAGLIREWMNGFVSDTGIAAPPERFLAPLLERRAFFLWEDDEPRSVVGSGRDTPNGACITAVYTPPRYRGKGYATASVAALSTMILASGREFCCLYTDLDNPTSNSIYRKIGYEPVRDDLELVFESD
jgi:GNAT superfamily N-acetyltransferase